MHADPGCLTQRSCLQGRTALADAILPDISDACERPAFPDGPGTIHYIVGKLPTHILATVEWQTKTHAHEAITALSFLREVRLCRSRVLAGNIASGNACSARRGWPHRWAVSAPFETGLNTLDCLLGQHGTSAAQVTSTEPGRFGFALKTSHVALVHRQAL